jgi:integrase
MNPHILSYTLPDAWETAIDGWLAWSIAAGMSPATRRTRRAHVRSVARRLGTAHPRDIGAADLLAILARPDCSIEHRRGLRAALASFYRCCVESGAVEVDPTVTLPKLRTPSGAPKPATDEIWNSLVAAADPRTALMARLACEAGLRRAEVAQVHSDDLNAGVGGAELIVHGKGDKQRVVPITVTLADAITAACPQGGFLFPGKIDGHMSADRVGHLVSRVMPAGWSMHKLRHRFATRGYAGTGNLRAVQEALGHASVATTQRYTAVSSAQVRMVSEAAAGIVPARGENSPVAEDDTAFQNVIAMWDEDGPACEVASLKTHTGKPCRRQARWSLNLHGCSRILLCERDIEAFRRNLLAGLHEGRPLQCVHCGQSFDRLDDACTTTRL